MPQSPRRRRVWPVAAAVMVAAALAGCADNGSSRKPEADRAAAAAYAQCEARRAAHQLPSHVAAVACAAPTVVDAYQEAGYPFDDLVDISIEARRIAAERLDDGQITQAQENRDLAVLATRITAEENRRIAATHVGGRPTPTPPEILVRGLASFAPTPAEAEGPVPPLAAGKNCFTLGPESHCQ
jgi:hypothetical protein